MISVVPFSPEHHALPAVVKLIRASAPEMFPIMFGPRVNSILQALVMRSHNRFSHRYLWVAEDDRKVIGIVFLVESEFLSDNADFATVLMPPERWWLRVMNRLIFSRVLYHNYPPRTAYIASLAVDSNYRNQGIGTQILTHCINHAIAQNLDALFIRVDIANPKAQRLYERLGFQPTTRDTLKFGIAEVGTVALTLPLGDRSK